MGYFVSSEEMEEAIDKAVNGLLITIEKYTRMMKEEIEKKIKELRLDLEKKKMLDEIKEEARNTGRQKNKLDGPKEDKKGENK